jgi:hypothetical protein
VQESKTCTLLLLFKSLSEEIGFAVMQSDKAQMATLPVYVVFRLSKQAKNLLHTKSREGGMPIVKQITDAITTCGKRIVREIQLFFKVRQVLIVMGFVSALCYVHFASDARLIKTE